MKTSMMILTVAMVMSSVAHGYVYSDYTWHTYNGHQYALTLDFGTWQQAETEAVAIGGHLVTINDAAEELWVVENSLLPEPEYTQFWIGLYQTPGSSEPGGGWVWISGEPANYINWAYPEPTNAPPSEDYATIQGGEGSYRGGWNDWGPERDGFVPSRGVIELSQQPPCIWQVVYQTDFSTDPGWTTDQPQSYYWNQPAGSYFVHNTNTYPGYYPNRYAGKTMDQPDGSFELQWDIQVTQCDWSAGLYFGLWDSSLQEPGQAGEFIMAVIGRSDGGRVITLTVGANGIGAEAGTAWQTNPWSLNKWYTFKISYDSDTKVANLEVFYRDTAQQIWSNTLAVPGGGFTKDLEFLGSNLGMVGSHGYSGINPGAVLNANLDNVVLYACAPGENNPPIADAGEDQVVYADADFTADIPLDGSGSSDPDGDELTYLWTWTMGGEAHQAEGVKPTIELPVGQHTVELIVNDGQEDSEPDQVVITVIAPMQANLLVVPRVINRYSSLPQIMAMVRLAHIWKDQVDAEKPLLLYPGGIEATSQRASECGRGGTHATMIIASFDKSDLMDAASENGSVELTGVGRLKSGQYFYGTDTIRIIAPGKHR